MTNPTDFENVTELCWVGGNNKKSDAVPIKMDLAGAKKAKTAVDSKK